MTLIKKCFQFKNKVFIDQQQFNYMAKIKF